MPAVLPFPPALSVLVIESRTGLSVSDAEMAEPPTGVTLAVLVKVAVAVAETVPETK